MNIVARNFGKLLFLALAGGLILGVTSARRGLDIDLGTVRGVHLALSAPRTTPTSLVPAGLFATATPQALGSAVTGSVQQVDGAIITVLLDDKSQARIAVSDGTAFVKADTISTKDIAAGDTVTVSGTAAADGAIAAEWLTVGPTVQTAGPATVTGSVEKIEGSVLTVISQSGQPAIVKLGASTRLQKTQRATLAEVTVGAPVAIDGHPGNGGVLNASTVQIGALR